MIKIKRPVTVWIFTILITIGILWELFSAVLFFGGLGQMTPITIIVTILGLILLIPRGIMIAKLFMLKKNALRWVRISYGSILTLSVIEYIIYFATLKPGIIPTALIIPPSFIMIGIFIFFWWAVADYIKKKKVDNQLIFT